MIKNINGQDAFYDIAWSRTFKYDRYEAATVLPELSGILCLACKIQSQFDILIFYACWRDGCRVALKKLMDPLITPYPEILDNLNTDELYYKYTIVDTSSRDMQDLMFWLIKSYEPPLNIKTFKDSERYKNIYVKESNLKREQVIERFPERHHR